MICSRKGWAAAACAALALGAFFLWRAGERRALVAASVPPRPDLGAWPIELRERIGSCERRVKGGPDRLAALAELSRLYHINGFHPEAIRCYQTLLQVDPSNARWPHRLATVLALYGQNDDAISLWHLTAKLEPGYIPARVRLGDALLNNNQPGEAARAYEAVLALKPDNAYAQLGLARIDFAAARWSAARERLDQIVAQTNYTLGYDLLVTVCERLGDTARARAVRARTKASSAFFDIPDPWLNELSDDCYDAYRLALLAGTASISGDPKTGIRLIERAVALAPANPYYHYQAAILHLNQGDHAAAQRHLERGVDLDSGLADAWLALANLHNTLGDAEGAERVFATALRHCPQSHVIRLEHGRRLAAASRFPEAIAEFRESIRLWPSEAEAHVDLAGVFFALGRSEEGAAELRCGLQAEPDNPDALVAIAQHAIDVGDEPEARGWLDRIRSQPRVPAGALQALEEAFLEKFDHPAR